ncbi:MAG TPA: phosphatase PAP2 family protein [Mycobacterium sp.]|nr:phosphatase PAP2 family protein [Mycobacterium sp.]
MTAVEQEPGTAVAVAPSAPTVPARRSGFWSRPAWREFVLLAAVYGLYALTRRITAGSADDAVSNAGRVLRAERAVRLAPERWLNQAVSTRPLLAVPADYAYASLHYVVTPIVLVWLWRAHPSAYLPARRTLMAATLLGLIGFATVPLSPPRMMPGFIDTMARYGHDGWWGSAASAPKGLGSFTNQFAAMPSLHVGWAIWCGVVVARHARRRWVRGLAVGYPVLVVLVVLSTANHYLLDAVAGLAVLITGYAIARAAVRLGWLRPAAPMLMEAR